MSPCAGTIAADDMLVARPCQWLPPVTGHDSGSIQYG